MDNRVKPQPPYPPRIYIKPGELYVAREPSLIETVLGSCISVAFYCPTKQCGALCHAMLPSGDEEDFKYVDVAINYMVDLIRTNGIVPNTVVAKLFGGADMFDTIKSSGVSRFTVGAKNIEMAQAVLAENGIEITRIDVGGNHGRKILFFTDSGRVFVKKLDKRIDSSALVVTNGG